MAGYCLRPFQRPATLETTAFNPEISMGSRKFFPLGSKQQQQMCSPRLSNSCHFKVYMSESNIWTSWQGTLKREQASTHVTSSVDFWGQRRCHHIRVHWLRAILGHGVFRRQVGRRRGVSYREGKKSTRFSHIFSSQTDCVCVPFHVCACSCVCTSM